MRVQLPTGFLDGQDLFNFAVVDELKGKQQNYLINRDLVVNNIGHVPKILEDLIVSLETKEGVKWQGANKDAIQKLPSSDIETLLIKIRENSFGPRFYFEATCEHCGHVNKDQRINLDKLEIKHYTLKNMLDESKRTLTLPKSKKIVVLKPMYIKDMFSSIKLATEKHDSIITGAVMLSISTIDGKPITEDDIANMSASDIHEIEKFLEKNSLEGNIDTDIEVTCSKCKTDFSTKLNVYEPHFFSPTRASKSSST